MKAVVYQGPKNVDVEDVPDPKLVNPTDAIIRITTTNICGSDLHMYEGRAGTEEGTIFGHENMGIVEDAGAGVTRIKRGDRVSVPFNVACGTCRSCNERWTSFCENVNPTEGMQGGAYGYAGMGPYDGGQAEYLRVPFADFNLLTLPPGDEHENDFTMLSDIFPTGWHGVVLSGFEPGDRVAVTGAGPVGLMAAHSALLMGAREVFVIDRHADRLKLAADYGATPIDYGKGDPGEQIREATDGVDVDRGVEAVGWQAHDTGGHEHAEMTLDTLVDVVKVHGGIGTIGVYVSQDPHAPTELARKGRPAWNFGTFFTKGQHMGTGQAPVKRYNRQQLQLILQGKARPGAIVSQEVRLADAPNAYENFDRRADGWTKVLLKPGA